MFCSILVDVRVEQFDIVQLVAFCFLVHAFIWPVSSQVVILNFSLSSIFIILTKDGRFLWWTILGDYPFYSLLISNVDCKTSSSYMIFLLNFSMIIWNDTFL